MNENFQEKDPALEEMAGKFSKASALRNKGSAEQFPGQVQKKTGQLKKIFAKQMRPGSCAFFLLERTDPESAPLHPAV